MNQVSPPVLVCGSLRSGTTLVHLMLDGHTRLANPGEFDYLLDHVDLAKTAEEFRDYLGKDRVFSWSKLTIDENAVTYRDVMDGFKRQLSSSEVTNCINLHRNFDRAYEFFPDSKYIHIVRDPRDVSRSCIGMGWVGHVYFGADTWLKAEESWERLQPKLAKDQYFEIIYEDLIKDSEGKLRELCGFLGIEFDPNMLEYPSRSTYSKPDVSLTNQWERKMTRREISLVENKCKALMLARGYQVGKDADKAPGGLEYAKLKLLDKTKKMLFAVKRYGLGLYLASRISSRFNIEPFAGYVRKRCHAVENAVMK